MTAADFLRALWTDKPAGYIQIWQLGDRRSTYLTDPAAAINFAGHTDVYAAVGMTNRKLGTNQRAKANQIAAIAGLWIDLDIGDGKIADRAAALALASAHLPPTTTVDSGNGLHAWYLLDDGPWIFTSMDEQTEAASLARRFVALHAATAAQTGGRIDSVGDLARLLRLPDTVNGKDPENPRPVEVIDANGPRHTLATIRALLADIPDTQQPSLARAGARAPVNLTGDTEAFHAKLDALLENSPDFHDAWHHKRGLTDPSPSAYDMSLCNLAAGAMTDPELALLIQTHRANWADWCSDHDRAERRPDGYSQRKGQRASYLRFTIDKARARSRRDQQLKQLDQMGRAA